MARHYEDHRTERIGWLRAAVLGANDGIVSTASLLVGVAAAASGKQEVIVAGVAGLGGGRAFLFALLWNAWSVVDAYRHEDDRPDDTRAGLVDRRLTRDTEELIESFDITSQIRRFGEVFERAARRR